MEAGLSLSIVEVAEEEMDTTPTRKEVDTVDMAAVAAAMGVEVATVDMVATIITEVVMEVATISSNQDSTTTIIIIIIIVMRVEIKRKIQVVMVVEILISQNLLMEIIKQNGLLMDRKRNQRSHPQRRKKQAQKMKLRIPKKCIKV